VQNHRIADNQLLALQTVDDEAGGCWEIELSELRTDRIETVDRAAVVILVVADDQLLDIPLIRAGSQASFFIA
jgi:hypothetical protein